MAAYLADRSHHCGSGLRARENSLMVKMPGPGADVIIKNSFRQGTLRPAVTRFFNEEIDAGRAFLRSHLESCPDDALAHAMVAALDLYGSLVAWILAGREVSADSLWRGHRMELSNDRRDAIMNSLRRAERSAEQVLADPDCADMGVFALALVSGIRRDYCGLVLNQWTESLTHAQEANLLGRRLLKANPGAHDAYCIFAWSEYLISRVPSVVRPFARIPGITGDRSRAIQYCEVASRTGCYYREFAACLQVALYAEEGKAAESMRLLSGLAGQFPNNSSMAAELKRRQLLTAG
jgi:hypothetical protein